MSRIRIDAVPGQGETITALYSAGVITARIAEYTGRSPRGLDRWLRRRGLWRPGRMTPETQADIERLYYDGLSIEQIAAAVGHSHGGVRYYLQSRDLFLPERTRVTPEKAAKIRQWYERGVKIAVIADRLGLGESTLYTHVRASRAVRVTAEQRQWMVERYRAGDYVLDIARATGRAQRTVRDVLKGAGVYEPGRKRQRVYRMWNKY